MDKKKPSILILYASYGDGHVQVSKALQQRFRERGIEHVLLIDLLAKAHPIMNAITRFIFLKSSTLWPNLYGWSYYITQNMRKEQVVTKWLNSLGVRSLKALIRKERPDAVIYTFPFPVIPDLQVSTESRVPTYTILTDFVLHHRWIHSEVYKYFVATGDLKKTMIASGVPDDQIQISGIPLRKAFGKPVNESFVYQLFGIDPNKKVVCILAGAYGVLKNASKIGQDLLAINEIELIFICGKNNTLKKSLEAFFCDDSRVHIVGYIENIQEVMAISSCLITKAGGITLSEALVMDLPVIVFRPLPGQELENARYLAQKGALEIVYHINELIEHVKGLLRQEGRMHNMRQAIRSLQQKDAVETVVADIIDEIEKRMLSFNGNVASFEGNGVYL